MDAETKDHDEIRIDTSWGEILYMYIDYGKAKYGVTVPPLEDYQRLLVCERFLRLVREYLPPSESVRLLEVQAKIARDLDRIEKKLRDDNELPF